MCFPFFAEKKENKQLAIKYPIQNLALVLMHSANSLNIVVLVLSLLVVDTLVSSPH